MQSAGAASAAFARVLHDTQPTRPTSLHLSLSWGAARFLIVAITAKRLAVGGSLMPFAADCMCRKEQGTYLCEIG